MFPFVAALYFHCMVGTHDADHWLVINISDIQMWVGGKGNLGDSGEKMNGIVVFLSAFDRGSLGVTWVWEKTFQLCHSRILNERLLTVVHVFITVTHVKPRMTEHKHWVAFVQVMQLTKYWGACTWGLRESYFIWLFVTPEVSTMARL